MAALRCLSAIVTMVTRHALAGTAGRGASQRAERPPKAWLRNADSSEKYGKDSLMIRW